MNIGEKIGDTYLHVNCGVGNNGAGFLGDNDLPVKVRLDRNDISQDLPAHMLDEKRGNAFSLSR